MNVDNSEEVRHQRIGFRAGLRSKQLTIIATVTYSP
jgi:hypothetical protein